MLADFSEAPLLMVRLTAAVSVSKAMRWHAGWAQADRRRDNDTTEVRTCRPGI